MPSVKNIIPRNEQNRIINPVCTSYNCNCGNYPINTISSACFKSHIPKDLKFTTSLICDKGFHLSNRTRNDENVTR